MKTTNWMSMGMAALISIHPSNGGPAHRATVAGALAVRMTGEASFGPARGQVHACDGSDCPASFSLELGSYSEKGAVVFSRGGSDRPKVGSYEVSPLPPGEEGTAGFHAVVSLGSLEQPIGAFHAVSGTVTITQSSNGRVVGHYEIRAVGFLATDLDNDDREILVRGGFSAEPAAPVKAFSSAIEGSVR